MPRHSSSGSSASSHPSFTSPSPTESFHSVLAVCAADLRACAESGKHYMDLAGEGNWLSNRIVPNYDYLASTTGACIVPSCGFDSVPS